MPETIEPNAVLPTIDGPLKLSQQHVAFLAVLATLSGDPNEALQFAQTEPDYFISQSNDWAAEQEVSL